MKLSPLTVTQSCPWSSQIADEEKKQNKKQQQQQQQIFQAFKK